MIATRSHRKLFSLLLIFLPIAAISQVGEGNETKTLSTAKFSISYPATWELNESGQMGTTLILLSPRESPSDKFSDNVNLIVQDLTGYNLDLDGYTKISEEQIKTLITNSKVMENKKIAAPVEHQKLVYTGDQGAFKLKFEQYYFVVGNSAYVLTFTAEQSNFDQLQTLGEAVLNSFSIK
jgi:hypothetical protein